MSCFHKFNRVVTISYYQAQKNPLQFCNGFLYKRKAATYSPTFAVPSARIGLTSLFGMGRGEP